MFCKKEKPVKYTGGSVEHSHGREDRQTSQNMLWCRDCFVDEWDCKSFGYSSKEECGKSWDGMKNVE